MIEQSAQAQAQLINDLLDVSRIILGKLSLDIQDIDPAAVIKEAVESVRPLAEQKKLNLESVIPATLRKVCADPMRLKQVYLNLLTNAIKFSPSGSKVEISMEIKEGVPSEIVRVEVRDHGKGIPPDFLPHIFDRFSQADSSSTRVHGGMGLGLAIVRSLVEQHRGSVQAISAGLRKGATFAVTLPLKPEISKEVPTRFRATGFGVSPTLVPLAQDQDLPGRLGTVYGWRRRAADRRRSSRARYAAPASEVIRGEGHGLRVGRGGVCGAQADPGRCPGV